MNKTFNLKNFMEKKAHYEGVQGYMVAQTRAWQNCVRCKMADGKGAHDSWEKCLEEYQETQGTIDWVAKNCHKDENEGVEKTAQQLQMGGYWERIKGYKSKGMTTAQAVSLALKDCEKAAQGIPAEKPPLPRSSM
jgi:hypothetical protein